MSKQKKKKPQPNPVSNTGKQRSTPSFTFSGFLESHNFYLLLLGVFVLWVTVIRWRFIPMPLERDEGEYAYLGHLILNGIAPYTEAANMKLPGTNYMYALIMAIFGESFGGIHKGFVFMNAGTMILLYFGMRNFFSPMTGFLTAVLYGLMAMSNHFLGFAAHATHFIVFYISLALFFFSKYEQDKKPLFAFLAGAMFGMAFLMKQQAVYFILFGGIVFLIFRFLEKQKNLRSIIVNSGIFTAGVFVPYLLLLLVMLLSGSFDRFWFWTVQYASKYATGLPWESGKELLSMTFTPIWEEHLWIYILAIIGFIVTAFSKLTVKQKILAFAFLVFGCLATTPGFFFRQHYFIVMVPAVALLAGIALDFAGRMINNSIKLKIIGTLVPVLILTVVFRSIVNFDAGGRLGGKFYYSAENPVLLCKYIYGTNPFIEAPEIAKYIEANSSDTDKVAVLGSEPEIPFYAHRRSASEHIYTYGLMEIHDYNLKMQEEMISQIEKAKPKFFVFCNVAFSWLMKPDSPMKIIEWGQKYSAENYDLVGLVDIPDQGLSTFYWNADAQRQPKNQNSIWIFKRKEKETNPPVIK